MKFEKITKVRLPFDRRDPEPKKNYGIGGLQIWFILKGPKGAVQFMAGFGIYLPHLYPEYLQKFGSDSLKSEITGWDVGYHALEPQYEEQSPMGECDVFDGKPCYYDGSSLRAEEWGQEIFSVRGQQPEELIWSKLEQEYKDRFGDENADFSGMNEHE